MDLTKRKTRVLEVVGVTSSGRITHMRELAFIAKGAHVEKFGRDLGVKHQVAVEESEG